jgi:hypothetical protein
MVVLPDSSVGKANCDSKVITSKATTVNTTAEMSNVRYSRRVIELILIEQRVA